MGNGILILTGPTATGKTALGVMLAKRLNGEVISADAMQLYRGMVIGTAAPTPEEMQGVPHHMVGIADPHESWSAGRYAEEAGAVVEALLARGKLPILVGGTNFYIDALLYGTDFAPGDPTVRAALEEEADRLGNEALWQRLREADPARAERLHPSDRRRVIRALEIQAVTGRKPSEFAASAGRTGRWPSVTIALSFANRERLYARIDSRVDRMFAAGLGDEVRELLNAGLTEEHTAMQAIGYKEVAEVLRAGEDPQSAAEAVRRNSRRYAKRQLSWLRGREEVHWFLRESESDLPDACRFAAELAEQAGIL